MKKIFRRHTLFFLSLMIIEAIVIIAAVIDFSIDTSGWPVIAPVLKFLRDWIIAVSVIIVCLGGLVFYVSARKTNRSRSLSRLHDWASDAIVILAQYRGQRSEKGFSPDDFEGLSGMINTMIAKSGGFYSGIFLDDDIRSRKKDVLDLLKEIKKESSRKDKSAFNGLSKLQHSLADMMFVTFESASNETTPEEKEKASVR